MEELFQGEFTNGIDTKGRVSVPADFRRILEANDPDWKSGENPRLVVLFGTPGLKCLEVYSVLAMNEILAQVRKLPPRSTQFRAAARMLASRSRKLQLDENGRVTLPKNLIEIAELQLQEKAIFAGMVSKFEIWHPDHYDADTDANLEYVAANSPDNDPLAMLGLG